MIIDSHDPRLLRFVIGMTDADRVMFGSDMSANSGGTAQRLFRIN
jgi:predicted TIM-barrel fold metal-dependent hydrolase